MTVDAIFKEAKAKFVWESDQAVFGKEEYWANHTQLQVALNKTGILLGDCDDFATWCVWNLRAEGFPARYVFCVTETGEGHCVAETEGNILDNRQDFVSPQNLLPYKWISISGYKPGDPWHEIIT
jgi:predicted transglutaminase-like cysteine proteinase